MKRYIRSTNYAMLNKSRLLAWLQGLGLQCELNRVSARGKRLCAELQFITCDSGTHERYFTPDDLPKSLWSSDSLDRGRSNMQTAEELGWVDSTTIDVDNYYRVLNRIGEELNHVLHEEFTDADDISVHESGSMFYRVMYTIIIDGSNNT